MSKFADQLTKTSQDEFRAFVTEGCLVAKMSLQSVLDIADTLAWVMVLVVTLSRDFWLQNSGIPPDVQQTIEDLPFGGQTLFSDKADEILQSFKHSRASLWSLGAYILAVQRYHCGVQQQHQQPYRSQCMFG